MDEAGVPPRRAVSCGWKQADWVLAFRAMLRLEDLELTQSKGKENRGWLAAQSGDCASVVCGLSLALLSGRFATGRGGPQVARCGV